MDEQRVDGRSVEVVMSWQGCVLETDLVSARAPRSVWIGPSGAVRFLVPEGALAARAELLAHEAGGFVVRAPVGGFLAAAQDGVPFEAPLDLTGARAVRLGPGVSVEVKVGELAFFVRESDEEADAPRAPLFDLGPMRWVAAAFALHAGVLGAFFFAPPNASALNLDRNGDEARYIRAHLTPPARIDELLAAHSAGEGADGTEADRAPAEASPGGAGGERVAVSGGPGRPNARSVARTGPLTAHDVSHLGVFAALTTSFAHAGDVDGAYGREDALAGPGGPGDFAALAAGGTGSFGGLELGGAGVGTCTHEPCGRGTVAVGPLATGGHGSGPSGELGPRAGRPGPRIEMCRDATCSTTEGGLSRELVRRTIGRHRNEVQFCYERELASRPDLSGRVTVSFVVTANGVVQTASASGEPGLTEVASCLERAVGRWDFPASPGPTGVRYPFVFSAPDA